MPTNVVARSAPFQRTTEDERKPLPLTLRVRPGAPALALDGERLLATGTGAVVTGLVSNVAITVVSAFNVTVHAAAPLQPPLQPENVDPDAAAAPRVTLAPAPTVSVHTLPQAIPAGVLVTVPAPVPLRVITSLTPAGLVADPVTVRETVSPFAAKLTLLAKVPAADGARRTTTA